MKNLSFFILIVFFGFTSCEEDDNLSSDLVVSTSLDKKAVFNSYKTYYISDTVINLGGTGADTIMVGATAQELVNSVKTNMSKAGYSFVPRLARPDMGMKIGVVDVVTVDAYPGWYQGYAGWFPTYWGGYYPYYYPWTTVYAYDTGTIIIDLYDLKNAATNGQYVVIWNSISFGALGSDTNANLTRGVNSINQGFIQSPYLHAN